MSKKYKRIINMGLAFDEDRAMVKLSKMAKKGWILSKMSLFNYKLVEGEPKELIYSMDFKKIDDNDKEYFELFEKSGWNHMCSYDAFHFFSAAPGTVPIYTDKENYLSKYSETKKIYLNTLVASSVVLLIVILTEVIIGSKINKKIMWIIDMIGLISGVLFVPSLMVTAAYFFRERKILKGKIK